MESTINSIFNLNPKSLKGNSIMNNYQKRKEAVRQLAIDWQLESAEQNLSYGELFEIGNYFYKLGKRFGLLREFRENAIPC